MSGDLARPPACPTLPGCRMREVVAISEPRAYQAQSFGRILKLECGHEQWVAGWNYSPANGDRLFRPCLEGPCYKFEKAMGDEC